MAGPGSSTVLVSDGDQNLQYVHSLGIHHWQVQVISPPQAASSVPNPNGANVHVGPELKAHINRYTHRITATYREPLAHLWASSCARLFMARYARLLDSVAGGCQGVRSEVANMSTSRGVELILTLSAPRHNRTWGPGELNHLTHDLDESLRMNATPATTLSRAQDSCHKPQLQQNEYPRQG